jgi:hypothetical protein
MRRVQVGTLWRQSIWSLDEFPDALSADLFLQYCGPLEIENHSTEFLLGTEGSTVGSGG